MARFFLNVRYMFSQYYFALPSRKNIEHNVFAWIFNQFACLPGMEGDMVRTKNYDYDKYFCIAA